MDTSNPLFSQIGIFARCLEERESIREEKHSSMMQAQQDPVSTRRAAPTQNDAPIEKRQTRRMKGRKNQQEAVTDEKKQEAEPMVNEEQIYLIEPQKRCEAPISDEILDKISIKAVKRSQKLAKRAKKQLEKEINSILLEQMQKVQIKFAQMRKIYSVFETEKQDLDMLREECLAERVALSAIKGGNFKGNATVEKGLW